MATSFHALSGNDGEGLSVIEEMKTVLAAIQSAEARVAATVIDVDQVAADLVQTNQDTIDTAANLAATNQDTIDTAANLAATNQDTVSTAADAAATNQDTIDTDADKAIIIGLHADVAANLLLTDADTAATAADRTQTGLDAVKTAADRFQTNIDQLAVASDKAIVAADAFTVNADKAIVAADAFTVNADKGTVAADKALVAADKATVAANLAATNQDTIDTAADLFQTNIDQLAVAADKVTVAADKALIAIDKAAVAADLAATNQDTIDTNANAVSTAADVVTTSGLATSVAAALASAEAARDATLAALDSFDDRYLGQKASAPTLDNDGNPLATGSLYFNTADDSMKVFDGVIWLNAYASLSGALLGNNNLSDLLNPTTSRTNLGVSIGSDVQAYSGILAATTASFTTALKSKLDVIEAGATGDQTGAEIKALYELELNTNALDDLLLAKLNGIEASATADQTGAEIKSLYELELDTNAFTNVLLAKLNGIEASATADQTAAQLLAAIKTVDGAGSGLDADLLDGISSAAFMRKDVTDYQSNTIYQRGYLENETGYRDRGVYGNYSSNKTNHIWSMGIAYKNHAAGTDFGNLYGLAYKHTDNATGGAMAGGHQVVWCQNGAGKAALGTNIWTSGNVTAYSDIRVKENLKRIPDALSKVLQLNGYTYDRTDQQPATPEEEGVTYAHNPTNRHVGVIAQEVLKVLPEAVTGGPSSDEGSDDDHYSVAYGNMVALLIEAVKEQQTQIQTLAARVEVLENDLT